MLKMICMGNKKMLEISMLARYYVAYDLLIIYVFNSISGHIHLRLPYGTLIKTFNLSP